MSLATYLLAIITFVTAVLMTGAMRKYTLARGLLDVPNERSSHAKPTPRGGGIAIVAASLLAACCLVLLDALTSNVFVAVVGGGIAVAVVGFVDDRSPLPARVRLLVHIAAAVWALLWVGGLAWAHAAGLRLLSEVALRVSAVAAIVWTLNLFNFMDGIDGIAASEAIFMSWGGAALLLLAGGAAGVAAVAVALGAACGGFLIWNWPPARIFMGDAGSGYLGYVIGVLMLSSAHGNAAVLCMWLVLGGVFFVDATVTLVRRALMGAKVYQAHRSHAYQWLARRWRSHERVTLTVMGVNLLWLLPCAWFALTNPRLAMWTMLVALAPLIVAAIAAGAGRPETNQELR